MRRKPSLSILNDKLVKSHRSPEYEYGKETFREKKWSLIMAAENNAIKTNYI